MAYIYYHSNIFDWCGTSLFVRLHANNLFGTHSATDANNNDLKYLVL